MTENAPSPNPSQCTWKRSRKKALCGEAEDEAQFGEECRELLSWDPGSTKVYEILPAPISWRFSVDTSDEEFDFPNAQVKHQCHFDIPALTHSEM